MKKLFYYKIEPFEGHYPSDKVRVNNIAFESGFFSDIVGMALSEQWQAIRYNYKESEKESFNAIIEQINNNIIAFMENKEVLDPLQKQFYLNFNHDGIDCFVSRYNWKN